MNRYGSAAWLGSFKTGSGVISTESGALKNAPYSVSSRFDGLPGTNPEELIGAAHAGCFSMAFALILSEAKFTAQRMDTQAVVTLEKDAGGYAITAVQLTIKAKIPDIDQAKFDELVNIAKSSCPVSKVLNAKISLTATLLP
jgi:lipoyl-dependent peroxiredoxin